ncbi:signal-transducing adaptor protein 2 [Varanus komodoensis]|uniref:signal-transducing adaptor protein 2 n=1 Tax=Varanus komodoensis TaxID=61221 RepID=UPI001CF7DB35|nr:signal-transducing adaptor protein 2 [Varanus komodoensis]
MAAQRSSAGRAKPTLPIHYHEGFLEKKGPRDKDFKKYWAGLFGLNLYFYNTKRDNQYVEKINLADFVSLADDNLPSTTAVRSRDGSRLNLKMRNQEVKLKMESLDAREMWKGFILTMVEMQVPSRLNLLPGHVCTLSQALEKEKERRSKLVDPFSLEEEKKLPECFFRVSRTEAEMLLEKNEHCGNMLLRPGGDGKSVSVTTRQKANGAVTIKHYKINLSGGEYIIDVEEPYCCSSLSDVVEFFVTNSKRVLVPLSLDESYAMTLEILEMDKESGESTSVPRWMAAPPQQLPRAGAPARKMFSSAPQARPPPCHLPPVLPVKPPLPGSAAKGSNNIYEEEDLPDQTYVNNEEVAEMKQTTLCRELKGIPALTAPSKPVRGSSLQRVMESPRSHPLIPPRNLCTEMTEELERKLQKRRARLEN